MSSNSLVVMSRTSMPAIKTPEGAGGDAAAGDHLLTGEIQLGVAHTDEGGKPWRPCPDFAAEMAFMTSGRSLLDAVKLKSILVPWGRSG